MSIDYSPGHTMHFIHARLLGERPWGWREGVVRESAAGTHVIDYVFEDGSITLWSDRLARLAVGTPVRVHEGLHGLEVDCTIYNVRKDSPGLGKVPDPAEPALWADEMFSVVADLAAGTGHAIRRTPPPDRAL